MQHVSFKTLLITTALFSATLNANQLRSSYASMQSTVKAMQNDASKQKLSSNYNGKLMDNLDALEQDLTKAIARSQALRGGRIQGVSTEGSSALLVDVAVAAVRSEQIDGFSQEARRNLLDELVHIKGSLNYRTDKDLLEDTKEAIEGLEESLGIKTRKTRRR